jgi:small-conductance mechanosensitive channel
MDLSAPHPSNVSGDSGADLPTDPAGNGSAAYAIGLRTEQRILWLTPLFGVAAALSALGVRRRGWAAGLLIGSILAWLNFMWLKRGLDALAEASQAQHGSEKPQVPLRTYALAALRYGLLGVAVYVIFKHLHVPLGSIVVGLCALGVATITASVWEIFAPAK